MPARDKGRLVLRAPSPGDGHHTAGRAPSGLRLGPRAWPGLREEVMGCPEDRVPLDPRTAVGSSGSFCRQAGNRRLAWSPGSGLWGKGTVPAGAKEEGNLWSTARGGIPGHNGQSRDGVVVAVKRQVTSNTESLGRSQPVETHS